MRLGVDPKVDVVFKRLFGNEDQAPLLVSLLNAVLEQPGSVRGVNIVLPQSDKEFVQDKVVIADIKARDQGNRQFHIEMQWEVPWFFPKRMLYYWAKFHPQQLLEGESYVTLRPTLALCFVNRALFPEVADHHLVFRLREVKHDLPFCDDLEIHLIELPKFTKSAEQLTTALDRWCYFMRYGADLDLENLPASLAVPDIRLAMEVLTVFTQEERERERYELRLKYERDQISLKRYYQEIEESARNVEQRLKDAEQHAKDAEQRAKDAAIEAERYHFSIVQDAKDSAERARLAEQHLKDAEQRIKDAEQRIKDAEQRAKDAEQRAKEAAVSRIHLAQRLLKQIPRPREELLPLPLEELLRLADALEQQLLPSTNGTS